MYFQKYKFMFDQKIKLYFDQFKTITGLNAMNAIEQNMQKYTTRT